MTRPHRRSREPFVRSDSCAIERSRRIVLPFLLAALLAGCSSSGTFKFLGDARINDGLVLTIDLVRATEDEAQKIRQTGEKWFYSSLRDDLSLKRTTIALEGGGTKSVEIPKAKGDEVLVIVADYRFESPEGRSANMEFLPAEKWAGKTITVRVQNRNLVIERVD